ncbi:MAG: methionine--tRNA ligase [Halobacteriovoraceae bacterium]|nr:methionine--tRNA ligase [Halobacteriovoraceae bacterium]|tara:strand:+ start:1594 stop:3288 length:1695 start_codon:yes stop_codon:yes gene_type:complete
MAKYLVTSALPYANGPLHFGHIAGVYLPADIFTRHKKLQGHQIIHISGSDEHGVAIMQNAQKKKKSYQEYVNQWHKTHKSLFDDYEIQFEFFGQTSAPYHKEETLLWFESLYRKGLIEKKAEDQLQCQSCHNYLPDRFVEGTCYVCDYEEARGDECPKCGEWIDAVKLKNPVCKFCGSKDIEVKSVDQWYLMLTKFSKEYREWFETRKPEWRKTVSSAIDSLTKEGMVDRAITRDLDWGIDVPLEEAKGKKFYVWFDAPIGYVSNTKEYCQTSGEDYLADWWQNDDVEIVNFIGKDNVIFHGIIFPMMSLASGRANAVTHLPANQYVNLLGKQFSKSKGWYVDADKAIKEFGPDALRYALTTLIPENNDSSFTWDGFEAKINNELANNIGNFVNRGMTFFYKNWKEEGIDATHFQSFFKTEAFLDLQTRVKEINATLDRIEIRRGLEQVMSLGQVANTYFSDHEPWAVIKVDKDKCAEIIAHSAIYALTLGCLFSTYLPNLSSKILEYFPDINDDLLRDIYTGEFKLGREYFNQTIVLTKKPKGLVKKVEADRIKELNEVLQSL